MVLFSVIVALLRFISRMMSHLFIACSYVTRVKKQCDVCWLYCENIFRKLFSMGVQLYDH